MEATVARADGTSGVEAVYRQEGARLWRALFLATGDAEVASDAMAEAFAQALGRGSAIHDVRRWIWRAAFRLAAGDMKRRSQLTQAAVPETAISDPRIDHELLVALDGLTPQQRVVIVLFYFADLPVSGIAQRTGMNSLAVRAHLSRGRKRLRSLLGDIDA
jgi:RNA polymerase sigma-70 factor (ECF subfamily)